MTAVSSAQLDTLYADGDDPWCFRTSGYEQEKFQATRNALLRTHYASALELGCGNGELAKRLSPICANYIGLDAVQAALTAARKAVRWGNFVQGYLPCTLPGHDHDLVVVSEVLYFLDLGGVRSLARQIAHRFSRAEIISVNWLGPSGNGIEGDEALLAFSQELDPLFAGTPVARTDRYRIDRFIRP